MKKIVLSKMPVVVLGRGIDLVNGCASPAIGSKLNTETAGILLYEFNASAIIFTGGHTKGPEHLSEADLMREYLYSRFPGISKTNIFTEPKSFDTLGNITELLKLGLIQKDMSLPLISVRQHLDRAKTYFRNIANIYAQTYSSQDILRTYGDSYQKQMVEEYESTPGYYFEVFKEGVLEAFTEFDGTGEKLRKLGSRFFQRFQYEAV